MQQEKKKDNLIELLRLTMQDKNLSPVEASGFLETSYRSIYRWLNYEAIPSKMARRAIKNGIRRMSKIN
jgi:hypothetical protein